MADKCEGDDANGFEDAFVDYKMAAQLASGLGGDAKRLSYNSNDDNDHAN
jgi:hypothetical protein